MSFNPDWFVDRLRQFHGFQEMLKRDQPQSLMLIEALEKMGKTWLLQQMAHHCQTIDTPIPAIYIDFRDPLINKVDEFQVVQLLGESFEAPEFFQPLFNEVGRVSGDLAWLPAESMQRLVDEILLSFTTEAQLIPLFRYVDANYDHLRGDDSNEKTFQLVKYCLERETLPLLLNTLRDLREARSETWSQLIEAVLHASENMVAQAPPGYRATLQASGEERDRVMQVITTTFIDCLKRYLGQQDRLVLLIDSYEDCPYEAQRWLETSFLHYLPDETLRNGLILVVAGIRTLLVRDAKVRDLILHDEEHEENPEKHGLTLFSPEHIEEYIEKRQIDADWATLDKLMITKGKPSVLAMIYELNLNS